MKRDLGLTVENLKRCGFTFAVLLFVQEHTTTCGLCEDWLRISLNTNSHSLIELLTEVIIKVAVEDLGFTPIIASTFRIYILSQLEGFLLTVSVSRAWT